MTEERFPKITVLMTVFNGGDYLKRSVESVLNQTYRNFELLVVDDASTDLSLELIRSFNDSRIRIYANEKNMGQARSLNTGLNLAKGKYIARIDADDIALPGWLQEQCAYMEKNPGCAVVSTKAVVIDENDKIRRIYDSPVSQEDVILRSFTFSPINHVGSLFDREIALNNGGYVEQYKIAADFGLWSNLIRHGHKITSTRKILVAIRAHSSSFSQSASGEKELQDLADIMLANVNAFTNAQISIEESKMICRAFFDEGSLTDDEFAQAERSLRTLYGDLISSLNIGKKHAQKWSDSRCLAAYLKRIFFFIKKKDYLSVRSALSKGVEEFGLLSPLGFIFILAFFGKVSLACIPPLSDKFMNIRAYFLMGNRLNMGELS